MRYAVIVRGTAVAPGTPVPDGIAPHPEPEERACTELTKAGEPCKGRPGDDGLCAAHKDAGET